MSEVAGICALYSCIFYARSVEPDVARLTAYFFLISSVAIELLKYFGGAAK